MVDLDRKLDNGMTVREAIARAKTWWDRKGRHLTAKVANDVEHGRKVAVSSGVVGIVVPGEQVAEIPSLAFRGTPWDELDTATKLQIVRAWYGAHKLAEGEPLSDHGQDVKRRLDIH